MTVYPNNDCRNVISACKGCSPSQHRRIVRVPCCMAQLDGLMLLRWSRNNVMRVLRRTVNMLSIYRFQKRGGLGKLSKALSSTSFIIKLATTTDTGDPIVVPCTYIHTHVCRPITTLGLRTRSYSVYMSNESDVQLVAAWPIWLVDSLAPFISVGSTF